MKHKSSHPKAKTYDINRAIKRLEKRGYTVNIPKTKVKTVKSAVDLYRYAQHGDFSGLEYRSIEQSLRAQKAAMTRSFNKEWENMSDYDKEATDPERYYREAGGYTNAPAVINNFIGDMNRIAGAGTVYKGYGRASKARYFEKKAESYTLDAIESITEAVNNSMQTDGEDNTAQKIMQIPSDVLRKALTYGAEGHQEAFEQVIDILSGGTGSGFSDFTEFAEYA